MVMDKKKFISISLSVIGIAALVVGAVFLIMKLNAGPTVADGEYLVEVGKWKLEDNTDCTDDDCETGVSWHFTEIGKGQLTTDSHLNDYDFEWMIEGGKLKIRTKWLYQLEDEYDYSLDQSAGRLILSDGDDEIVFVKE